MQRIQLEIEDKVLNIFNIYDAPNNEDINFFNILEINLETFSDQTLLVGPILIQLHLIH